MADGAAPLIQRRGCERGWPDRVANRIDVRHRGLAIFIHGQDPAGGRGQSRRADVQAIQASDAAEREEDFFARHHFTAGQRRDHLIDAIKDAAPRFLLTDEAPAHFSEGVQEAIGQLRIHEADGMLSSVEHRHLHAQGREDRRVLARDHARAQHGQGLRKVGHREDRIAAENVLVVDGYVRGRARLRADRDHHEAGRGAAHFAVDSAHLDFVRGDESGATVTMRDAIAGRCSAR